MATTVNALSLLKLRTKRYRVFAGDWTVAGGMEEVGVTEGGIEVKFNEALSELKLEEVTAGAVHEREVINEWVESVSIPFIAGNEALYERINPTGFGGGGTTEPVAVVEEGLLLIPENEMSGSPLSFAYNGTAWTGTPGNAAPKHAILIPRGSWKRLDRRAEHNQNWNRVIVTAEFRPMQDITLPQHYQNFITDFAAAITAGVDMLF
jgi:hypothetical protein